MPNPQNSSNVADVTAKRASSKRDLSDGQILGILKSEKENSVGFSGSGDTLDQQRIRALRYYKGDMRDVAVAGDNRSSATDSTVADTVETVLPDLMEIFTEEEAVAFEALSDDDADAAQAATDMVRDIIFNQNEGWLALYSAFKDALVAKLGVIKFWYQEGEREERKVSEDEARSLKIGEQLEQVQEEDEDGELSIQYYAVKQTEPKIMVEAVDPGDFSASDDTVRIVDADYCVHRSDERIQDLLERGYDETKVLSLDRHDADTDTTDYARDTVGETNASDNDTDEYMRHVTINEHYIRTDVDGDGIKYWKFTTSTDESLILDREEVRGIPFVTFTPFINPHRLVGLSIADKTLESQKTKTALKRIMLDSAYFALNQRLVVSDRESNEFTMADLLRNEPAVPIRAKSVTAVAPIQSAGLGFDVLGGLEYEASDAETRSGVIRNAQGLNPDSLHDTASGQASMLTMSQKRTRMIARCFAETGFRDLCVGVYEIHRLYVNPEAPPRNSMSIQIGANGSQAKLSAMGLFNGAMSQVIEVQGGANGPIIDYDSIYQAFTKMAELMPLKGLANIIKKPPPPNPQAPPPPDPEMEKVKAEMQMKQAEMQQTAQMEAQKLQLDTQAKQAELTAKAQQAQLDNQLRRDEAAAKITMMREDAGLKAQLAREKATFEASLAREKAEFEKEMAERSFAQQSRMAENQVTLKKNREGGDLDK